MSINLKHKNSSFILFDFDGTLADSFDVAVDVFNHIAQEHNFAFITPEEKQHIRTMSMKDIITKFIKIPWYRVPFFYNQGKKLMTQKINLIEPFEGIKEALYDLKQQGFKLGILTSSNKEYVETFLEKNDLSIFDVVYADTNLFGKHHGLKKLMRSLNVSSQRILYVGDEVRDIQAAHNAGTDVIAVSWGYNAYQALADQKPLAIVHNPNELVEYILSKNY